MYAVLTQYGGCVLAAMWMGGMVLMFLRFRAAQVAYLKKFPPINGAPLEMILGGISASAELETVTNAMVDHQSDPERERLREEARRKNRHVAYWIFGFPVLAIGVGALVLTFFPH